MMLQHTVYGCNSFYGSEYIIQRKRGRTRQIMSLKHIIYKTKCSGLRCVVFATVISSSIDVTRPLHVEFKFNIYSVFNLLKKNSRMDGNLNCTLLSAVSKCPLMVASHDFLSCPCLRSSVCCSNLIQAWVKKEKEKETKTKRRKHLRNQYFLKES